LRDAWDTNTDRNRGCLVAAPGGLELLPARQFPFPVKRS
jgi:hypothetical protein